MFIKDEKVQFEEVELLANRKIDKISCHLCKSKITYHARTIY